MSTICLSLSFRAVFKGSSFVVTHRFFFLSLSVLFAAEHVIHAYIAGYSPSICHWNVTVMEKPPTISHWMNKIHFHPWLCATQFWKEVILHSFSLHDACTRNRLFIHHFVFSHFRRLKGNPFLCWMIQCVNNGASWNLSHSHVWLVGQFEWGCSHILISHFEMTNTITDYALESIYNAQ